MNLLKGFSRVVAVLIPLIVSPAIACAAMNPISYTQVPGTGFPALTQIGNSYSVVYTLKNNLPFSKSVSVTYVTKGSGFSVTNGCINPLAANGGTCMVKVSFQPVVSGEESIQLTLQYDRNVVPLPVLSSTVQSTESGDLQGVVTKALPASTNVGTAYPVEFTFAQTGSNHVINSAIALAGDTANLAEIDDACANVELTPVHPSCTVTAVYTPSKEGEATVGVTYKYQDNAKSLSLSTHTVASHNSGGCASVAGSTALLLPAQTYQYANNVVKFTFTNHCDAAAATLGAVNLSASLGANAQNGWMTKGEDTCSNQTLAANHSCHVYAAVSPEATGSDLKVKASVNYSQSGQAKQASATTVSAVLANRGDQRMVTVINQCPFPVWMSFQAAAAPGSPTPSCAGGQSCPQGTVCNTQNHLCYWKNPALDGKHPNGRLQMALPNAAPDTMDVVINQDNAGTNPTQNILYNAGIVARLQCTGSGSSLSCTVNNCGGTVNPAAGSTTSAGLCAPGIGVSTTPGISFNAVEFTFLRNYSAKDQTTDGVYDQQTINGVNVPMEIKGRGPETSGSAPYNNCSAAGAIIQKTTGQAATQLGACSYNYSPPNEAPFRASNYRFVTPVGNIDCADDDNKCTAPNVCGLSYDLGMNQISKKCGTLQGYVSVNTGICSQAEALFAHNISDLPDTYDCTTSYRGGFFTGAELYACSGAYAGQSYYNPDKSKPADTCCGCVNWWQEGLAVPTSTQSCTLNGTLYSNPDWTNPDGIVQKQIQWMKEACPTAYAYQYDDPSSSFHCTVLNSSQTQIVTNYQVTFCPGGRQIVNE